MADVPFMDTPVQTTMVVEDTPTGQRVEDGIPIDIYRLRGVTINNTSGFAWDMTITKNGVEVYSAAIPVGLVRAFVIQNNRRFDFDQYGITVSRIR